MRRLNWVERRQTSREGFWKRSGDVGIEVCFTSLLSGESWVREKWCIIRKWLICVMWGGSGWRWQLMYTKSLEYGWICWVDVWGLESQKSRRLGWLLCLWKCSEIIWFKGTVTYRYTPGVQTLPTFFLIKKNNSNSIIVIVYSLSEDLSTILVYHLHILWLLQEMAELDRMGGKICWTMLHPILQILFIRSQEKTSNLNRDLNIGPPDF